MAGKKKGVQHEIDMCDVGDLKPYERNARVHSEAQIEQIMASIREFGFTVPILTDPRNGVIAGHGRLEAAKRLGMAQVPRLVAKGWTAAQKRAYVIADNKLTENGGWDEDILRLEIGDLVELDFDIDLLGFGDGIDDILQDLSKEAPDDFPEYDENIKTEHKCPKCGYQFSGGKETAVSNSNNGGDS